MEESQNSSKPIIVNDLDLILHPPESDEYAQRQGYVGSKFETKVVDFNSLFDENGDIEDGSNQKVVDQQEDEGLAADEAEEDEVPSSSDLDTPTVSSPSSPSDLSSSSSSSSDDYGGRGGGGGLVHSAGGGAGGGSNEDVEKPSFLQMALLDEEKIGGCTSTSLVKDSKATLLPRSFPTRPRNCIHHMIPFSLFTQDMLKRFPSNLHVKRSLMVKHGEPNTMSAYFMRSPSGIHYLSLMGVNTEDIPSVSVSGQIKEKSTSTSVSGSGGSIKTKKEPKQPRLPKQPKQSKQPEPRTSLPKPIVMSTPKPRRVTPKVKCQFCEKIYKQLGALKRHTKDKHGVALN